MNIILCDDHRLFRQGIKSMITLLGSKYRVVGEASNGSELLDLLKETVADMVFIDLMMPVMNGYETTRQIRQLHPKLKILVVTMDDQELSMIRLMRLGINGFIGKDSSPSQLKTALEEIEKGEYFFSDFAQSAPSRPQQNAGLLTQTERRILELSATELTYKEIADRMYLSPKTIDNYRAGIFEKLGVKSRVGAVMHALRQGWIKIT